MSMFNKIGVLHKRRGFDATDEMKAYFGKDLTYYEIPEGVTEIRSYCFYNFWNAEGLTIKLPRTVKRIAPYAFTECSIHEIVIPGSVKVIDDFAFFGTGMTKVVFEEGIEHIGEGAFKWGPILDKIVIPDSVKYIGKDAFSGMNFTAGGSYVEIGEGVEFIGDGAFESPIEKLIIHKPFGSMQDGSVSYYDDEGVKVDARWYGGFTDNPIAIWDGG